MFTRQIGNGPETWSRNNKEITADDYELFMNEMTSPRQNSSTPLLIILKAHLITDVFKNRIIPSDWFNYYYKSLFIDDPKLLEHYAKLNENILKNKD